MKKCVEIREMLFKNWKLLFENINQTPPLNSKTFYFLRNNYNMLLTSQFEPFSSRPSNILYIESLYVEKYQFNYMEMVPVNLKRILSTYMTFHVLRLHVNILCQVLELTYVFLQLMTNI